MGTNLPLSGDVDALPNKPNEDYASKPRPLKSVINTGTVSYLSSGNSSDPSLKYRFGRQESMHRQTADSPDHNDQVRKLTGLGVGISSIMAENLLSHPCVILRRQCQVNCEASKYHLQPFTLVPVLANMGINQGAGAMWSGIGSLFVIRALQMVTETAVSEFTPLPKEVTAHSSLRKMGQHLLLKGISQMIITPFYAASVVEIVQSSRAGERPALFNCLTEGFARLYMRASSKRMIPLYKLVIPSAIYGVLHHAISSITEYTVLKVNGEQESQYLHLPVSSSAGAALPSQQAQAVSSLQKYLPELIASFSGHLMADLLLYPLETILHRLIVQGTRTIIDNTDTGLEVVAINTSYEGPLDCVLSTLREEGPSGFFRGFGALVLQYSVHAALLRLTHFVLAKLAEQQGRGMRRRGRGAGGARGRGGVGPSSGSSSSGELPGGIRRGGETGWGSSGGSGDRPLGGWPTSSYAAPTAPGQTGYLGRAGPGTAEGRRRRQNPQSTRSSAPQLSPGPTTHRHHEMWQDTGSEEG